MGRPVLAELERHIITPKPPARPERGLGDWARSIFPEQAEGGEEARLAPT